MSLGHSRMGARLPKLAALAGLLVFLGVGMGRGEEAPFAIPVDKVCGVDTYHAPNAIQDCKAQSATNLLFDQGVAAEVREGLVTYIETGIEAPVRGAWWYREPDGTDWAVGLASGTLFAYDGTSTSTVLSGLDSDNRMDCAQCLAELYCVNRSTHLFSWNGTSVTYSTHAPVAALVECWRNRIVLGDVSGEQSTLYLSGELEPDDYTPVVNISSTPVIWRVGGVDDAGNRIRCLRAGYGDFLYVGAPGRTYGFFGNDARDFALQEISSDVGCLDDGTVQEHLGELTWVSNQGVERFDRNVLRYPRVSEDIRNVTDGLIASAASEFSWVQTTQGDFANGTHDLTSSSISPGNVVLSTYGATDTSNSDFSGGTTSNTSVIGDRVYLSTSNANVDNNSFEDGSGTDASNWTEDSFSRQNIFCTAVDGSYSMRSVAVLAGSALTVAVLDSAGSVLGTQSLGVDSSFTQCVWVSKTVSLSAYAGRQIKLKFYSTKNSGGEASVTSDIFLASGNDMTLSVTTSLSGPTLRTFHLDNLTGGRSGIYTGTFTSRAFDFSTSAAGWVIVNSSFTTNGHSISFQGQTSADGVSWDPLVAVSTASGAITPVNRYARYVVTFSTGGGTNGTALPFVDDVTLSARSSTGTFISDAKDVTGATIWGNFEANQTENGGVIAYFVRSAASEGGLTAATWVSQTPFTTISAAVNNWVQYKASFTITTGNQDPLHHDATIFWRTGAASPAMASVVFRDRYHLFYTTSTDEDAHNDIAAPLDRFGQWTFFSGVNAASATRFRNLLLYGDSNPTGKIYRLYSGYNDDGAAIPVSLVLKDFDAGNMDALKLFDKLYITAGHETEESHDVDIDVSYTVDGDDDVFDLGAFNLGESTGRINAKIPFAVDGSLLLQGRWMSPRLSGQILDSRFQLFGLRIYGSMLEVE